MYYILHTRNNESFHDISWTLSSKTNDGDLIYDTYFFSKKNIYRVISEGQEQSFIIYNIIRQDGYDYRVVVLKTHIHPKHNHLAPGYGQGTLTVVDIGDDKLFIGHKINNKSIPQYYSGFYRQ